ncbi:MAG TPA: hypothetical protein VFI47_31250, partial [Acidimicrobiales bacterium]|nr:hypothetical protein [Acidimicrobiales bacterium]
MVWNDILRDEARQELVAYVQPLVRSRGTTDEEVERQWLVLEWVLTSAVPTCLGAVGLAEHAGRLARLRRVRSPRELASVAPAAEAAAGAAQEAHEAGWRSVADLAQPETPRTRNRPPWRPAGGDVDPHRVAAWGGLADGTRAAVQVTSGALRPATSALGYDVADASRLPRAWLALTGAFD